MKLEEAKEIAEKYVNLFRPYSRRIEIAGSIRRKKPEVKDIEIVMIRNTAKLAEFKEIVEKLQKVKGEAIGRYTQRILPEGIKLDLFFAIPENWGNTFAIRTGSADYSHEIIAKGWVKAGYKSENGFLHKAGKVIPIFEEEELFNLINVKMVDPEKREFGGKLELET